ncbi:tyrosine-protein kinase [uncultured Bacteroides sp.]|uniref:GumC family protein n=1 Tax=uncultured Bacteroides sp. TaxID=162156 RepID=UPI002666930C|nr:tyrosine-protein kinase [uncultured Bacteroides sp.]
MSETQQHSRPAAKTDDFIRIQDLYYLCLAKWRWFVLSLVVCLGTAVVYLLMTPPVYTRTASLLIKEESKGQSLSGDVGASFSDLGLFQSNTNVNNELISLQSPAVMYDVVKRLHLEVDYSTKGSFYPQVRYGQNLPLTVSFAGLADNETAALTVEPVQSKGIKLKAFVHNGEKVDGEVVGTLNDSLVTPIGKLVIRPAGAFVDWQKSSEPLTVSRSGLNSAVSRYAAGLSVALNDEKATIIDLSFRDVCIQRAEDILNTLIAVYNENWIKDKNQIAVSTSMFINDRLGVIEGELGHVDENISTFKSENLLPDVQAASQLYMTERSQAQSQILTLNTQLSMARYIRNYLTAASSRNQLLPANSGLESANIENQISEYNTLQLQRNNLVANSSEQNPLVVDMDESLRSMRRSIVSSVDNLITTLNTQIRSLEKSDQRATERIAANPSQAKYLLSVERQQKVKESLYLFLLQKREENELSQAFTAYNTRVITPPTGSMIPTAPVKKNILLVGFALGLLIPIVIVFLQETLNTRVRGKKDLENLSIPFVGEIPLYGKVRRSGLFHKKVTPLTETRVVVKEGSRDVVNEAFRVLRTNLEFVSGENGKGQVILMTSFNPGSGKTFLTVNIAATLAIKGKRVLVIDGDLRRSSTSVYVGSPHHGLSNYLAGKVEHIEDVIVPASETVRFDVLPIGTIPPNPTELLAGERLQALLADFRTRYDYILIDCPPIELVADTHIIEKYADRTIFVVRAGLLERSMLPELETLYTEHKFKNMAVLLNGTEGNGSYRYGYRYGYHYGYGSNYYYGNEKQKQ